MVKSKAIGSEAVRAINNWSVNKQVVVKLHDQLIAIQVYKN